MYGSNLSAKNYISLYKVLLNHTLLMPSQTWINLLIALLLCSILQQSNRKEVTEKSSEESKREGEKNKSGALKGSLLIFFGMAVP